METLKGVGMLGSQPTVTEGGLPSELGGEGVCSKGVCDGEAATSGTACACLGCRLTVTEREIFRLSKLTNI